jgi:hypothetical protein
MDQRSFYPALIRSKLGDLIAGLITERDCLESIIDVCVERIVDLDGGRNDDTPTGGFRRSELPLVMVEGAGVDEGEPVSDAMIQAVEATLPIRVAGDRTLARLDADRKALPLTTLKKTLAVQPDETFGEETHAPVRLTLHDETGDSYTILPPSL